MEMIESLKTKVILLGFVILVLVIFICLLLLRANSSGKYVINANSQAVIKQLQSLNRLETASYSIEKVIEAGTSGNQFQQILFGDKILLIASGKVIAGIDLSHLQARDVEVSGDTLRLHLPAPEILVTSLDNKETRVYDRRLGLFSKGDVNLESQARGAAETTIRQAACSGGILSEAAKNAQTQLSSLFKTLQFKTVIISIPSGSC